MERIYEQSKDLHVTAVIVYLESETIYEDAELSAIVPNEVVKDLFFKGLLVGRFYDGHFEIATKYVPGAGVTFGDSAVYYKGADPEEA